MGRLRQPLKNFLILLEVLYMQRGLHIESNKTKIRQL